MDSSGYRERLFTPEKVTPSTRTLNFIFWLLEAPEYHIPFVVLALAGAAKVALELNWAQFAGVAIATPILAPVLLALGLVAGSRSHDPASQKGNLNWEDYVTIKDSRVAASYRGVKIPFETAIELYMNGGLDFKGEVLETLWLRKKIFRFCFTLGHVRFFLTKFTGQLINHAQSTDSHEVKEVYDRGNSFYAGFLGPRMIYTSGIFHDEDESLEEAQDRKLDMVCTKTHMKKGDKHLDIGCGWGTLICHAAANYGTVSTGVTLATEQKNWMEEVNAPDYGVKPGKDVNILIMDYRDIPVPEDKYDVITCLEMAEHVGIKNFAAFLTQVSDMLKDDGFFYLQIAGLRRQWRYEDLIWGLFMGTYIFPTADASCPLGFVVEQCERAGYEVKTVENCGVHYSLTLNHWYNNWLENKEDMIEEYGTWWYKNTVIFLAWSTIIASHGSSTVFMLTLYKNRSQFERKDTSVGETAVAVQL